MASRNQKNLKVKKRCAALSEWFQICAPQWPWIVVFKDELEFLWQNPGNPDLDKRWCYHKRARNSSDDNKCHCANKEIFKPSILSPRW